MKKGREIGYEPMDKLLSDSHLIFPCCFCNAALRRLQARGNAEYRKLKINHLMKQGNLPNRLQLFRLWTDNDQRRNGQQGICRQSAMNARKWL